ncbi:MAG: hypothetical protein ACYTBJ_13695 [Planctomycetota bacterium]
MRVMKLALFSFLLGCVVFSGDTNAAEIQPFITSMPASSGGLFSFDLAITEDPGISATAFQATVGSVGGPGGLTFDVAASQAVDAQPLYWVYTNSDGATAIDNGDGSYTFGDDPADGLAQVLAPGDIMARYAFSWNGTEGDYTFTFDFDTTESYIQLEDFSSREALQLPTGSWYAYPIVSADGSSFTVNIPEPATLGLFALTSLFLIRHRRDGSRHLAGRR